jgi:WD40 repeat protein
LADENVAGVPLHHVDGSVHTVSITYAGGQALAVTGGGRVLRTWELSTNQLLDEFTCSEVGFASAIVDLAEGPAVVVAGGGKEALIRDLATKSVRRITISRNGWTRAVAIADGGATLLAAGDDGLIAVVDLATGHSLYEPIEGHEGHIYGLSAGRLADREIILSGGKDRTARFWDLTNGATIGDPIVGHRHYIRATALARLGNDCVAVTGSDDATARVWAIEDGRRGYIDVCERDGEWHVVTNGPDCMVAISVTSGEIKDLPSEYIPAPTPIALQTLDIDTKGLHVGESLLYRQKTPDGHLIVATEKEIIVYRAH